MVVGLADPSVVSRWDSQSAAAAEKWYPANDLVRLERWFFKQPGRVLDYGTGAGVNAVHLARRGYTVEALDASGEMVKVARQRAADHGVGDKVSVDKIEASATRLPFDDNSFDFVVCVNVLSLVGSRERIELLLSEFRRVVKPQGKLILDVNAASADFARNSRMIEPDVYLFKGADGKETGIPTYCPPDADTFAALVGKFFAVDDVGYTSFKYLHSTITEFIVCCHKA
ncbi:MAG: class I SAM-dependent methyltransferase [Pseudomonadota bacterium]